MVSITINEKDLVSIISALKALSDRVDILDKAIKKSNNSNGRVLILETLGTPAIPPAIGVRAHAFDGITLEIWEGTKDGWKQIL